jgi:LAS superfamily LD-carboxypeptidase LdcB
MSTYAPTVYATGLYGGGYVTSDTKAAIIKLFADAKTKGISPRISSSYRSYQTQQSLFNAYVKNEMSDGLTEAQAIIKANTYSARPGQSEHQLGTTLDVVGCPTACSFHDSRNTPVYDYLRANAHKFGFAISYPNGSQNYTGYIYEPWHIRFIGATRATELYNKKYLSKTGYYLYHYLIEKQEY